MTHAMRPIHPQAVPDDPLAVRWVVHTGTQGVVGEVVAAPDPFGALMRDRVISLACWNRGDLGLAGPREHLGRLRPQGA